MSRKTNCLITIANFGRIRVKVTRVVHGMSVIEYSSSGKSRKAEAFYPSKRTSGSFDLTVVCTTDDGYRRLSEWLERYSRWAASPKTKAVPVRVVIPSRKFDQVGVLESGVTYGDDVRAITHEMTLSFAGSRDPLELVNKNLSEFRLPRDKSDAALPYLYPGGTQLRAGEKGWDTVWDQGIDEMGPPPDDGIPYDDPPGGAW